MAFADESPTAGVFCAVDIAERFAERFRDTCKPRLLTSKATSAAKRTCVTGVIRKKNTVSKDV